MGTSDASRALPTSDTNSTPPAVLPLVTINDLLWLLYLYPVRLLSSVLPRWFVYAIAKLSDPIVQFDARRRKARGAAWIEQACRTTPAQARRIARQSLSNNMFRTLDGLLLLRPSFGRMLRCREIEGFQHLESALARGKGVVLLSGHFCANRVALRYLAAQGHAVLSVHGQPANKLQGQLGQLLLPLSTQLQKRANPDRVYVHDPDCSLSILRRLRGGGSVALMIDGHRRGTDHVFLGVPWGVRSGIFEVIRLSDCAVVPILCRGRGSGFRIRFDPMLDVERASSREAFMSANLPRFFGVVEKQIIENPKEWGLWNYW
jgi:lauroyl/myristoyl acyltransferase